MYAIGLFLLLIASSAHAQRDFAEAQITVEAVAGKVYMLHGPGGNIGVQSGPDGLLLIDDKFAPLAEKIRAAMGTIGEGDLLYVLNTHYHGDHTGGNSVFGVEAPIVAHDNVRQRLADKPPAAQPVITFAEGLTLHLNGEAVEVVHFPGAHTDGDGAVFFSESKVVHTGDLFFNGRFPFVDIDAGGSVQGVIRAVEAILARIDEDTRIIPGHGAVASPDDMRLYLRMLKESLQTMRQASAAGQPAAEVELGADWADWGSGFISTERWLATLERTLAEGE